MNTCLNSRILAQDRPELAGDNAGKEVHRLIKLHVIKLGSMPMPMQASRQSVTPMVGQVYEVAPGKLSTVLSKRTAKCNKHTLLTHIKKQYVQILCREAEVSI